MARPRVTGFWVPPKKNVQQETVSEASRYAASRSVGILAKLGHLKKFGTQIQDCVPGGSHF